MAWSDWQDYGTRSFAHLRFAPDTLDTGLVVLQYAEAAPDATSWPDMADQLTEQLDAARTGTGTFGPPGPGQAEVLFSADKSNRLASAPGYAWHASVQLGQTYITFSDPGHEADLDPLPPLLAGLVQGVDWDYNPDTGEAVEYDGLAVRVGWEDWQTTVEVGVGPGIGQEATLTDNEVTGYADYNQSYYWQALAADPDGWLAFGAGTTVAVHDAHSSVAEPVYEDALVLALTGLGDVPAVRLAVQPGTLGAEDVPIADFAVTTGPDPDTSSRVYGQRVSTWGIDLHRYDQPGPAVVYQQPRFRYWIPVPAEPPYLRFAQRDDGMGIVSHPRLNVASTAANQPSSIQHARAPRVGQANTYL